MRALQIRSMTPGIRCSLHPVTKERFLEYSQIMRSPDFNYHLTIPCLSSASPPLDLDYPAHVVQATDNSRMHAFMFDKLSH